MPAVKRSRDDMEQGARKKLKHHRSEESTPRPEIIDLASDVAGPAESARPSSLRPDDESTKALRVLYTDFDALRSLVTCKICERLLYEPYVLSCGHTYCYSCLSTWFQGKRKKTCPNCRDVIRHMPAPSYIIKEMTSVFIARAELVPNGETTEQHAQWRQEESDIVQNDKNDNHPVTGGLFKGSFTGRHQGLGPIFDREDNVERCPSCNWEIEEGVCAHCNYRVDDGWGVDSEEDISDDVSDELDGPQDDFDDVDADFDHSRAYHAGMRDIYDLHQRYVHNYGNVNHDAVFGGFNHDSDDDSQEDEDEEDPSLDGFIDDDDEVDDMGHVIHINSGVASNPSSSSAASTPHARRHRRVIDSDDSDDSDDGTLSSSRNFPTRTNNAPASQVEVVASRPTTSSRRGRVPITIVDSDDESLDSTSDDGSEDLDEDSSGGSSSGQGSDVDEGSQEGQDDDEEGNGFSSLEPSDDDQGSYDEDGGVDEHHHWG